ncbi:MAG TPA: hypothetical protein VIY47_15710, partial [Ignavibacteriaceae bacterium]
FPDEIREMIFDRILSQGGLLMDALTALMFVEEHGYSMETEWGLKRAIFEAKNIRKKIRKSWFKNRSNL